MLGKVFKKIRDAEEVKIDLVSVSATSGWNE